MAVSIEMGRKVLQAQPFSRLLDAELTEFSPRGIELHVPISDQLKQQHGFVHGGVLSYAADNALTFAGGHALGPAVVTSEFKINYVRPATGQKLIARANVVHAGTTQAICRCEISCVDGDTETLCAVAQGTIVALGGRDAS